MGGSICLQMEMLLVRLIIIQKSHNICPNRDTSIQNFNMTFCCASNAVIKICQNRKKSKLLFIH